MFHEFSILQAGITLGAARRGFTAGRKERTLDVMFHQFSILRAGITPGAAWRGCTERTLDVMFFHELSILRAGITPGLCSAWVYSRKRREDT